MNSVHDMGGMHGMGPSSTTRTSPCSTSRGRVVRGRSCARWAVGAGPGPETSATSSS